MPADLWSRSKCGLKILPYYAAGLPVIADSVGVHAEMIQAGVTGFLADTDEQWLEAIGPLSAAQTRRRRGRAARDFIEPQYSVAARRQRFVNTSRRRWRSIIHETRTGAAAS